jgi:hypothetical protein
VSLLSLVGRGIGATGILIVVVGCVLEFADGRPREFGAYIILGIAVVCGWSLVSLGAVLAVVGDRRDRRRRPPAQGT